MSALRCATLCSWIAAAVLVPPSAMGQTNRGAAANTQVKQTLPDEAIRLFRWRSIGPASMGGRITAIAVYEADPNIWWAASASGGLLKTTNNGVTFEHQFDRQSTVSIGDVQVCQSNPDIVWVGTGEANPRNSVSWGDGVYKSTDGGKTWKNMGLSKIFQTGRIAIHPSDPDIVFVGALGRLWGSNPDRGLYKTTDGGKTWKKVLFVDDDTGVIDVRINPSDPNIVLAATYVRRRDGFDGNDPAVKFGEGAGIYRSTDGGETFTKMTEGLPRVKMGRIGLDFYRQDPQHVYAIIETEKIGQMPEDFPFVGFSGESVAAGARITALTKDSSAEKAGLQVGDVVISVDGRRVLNYDDLLREVRKKTAGSKASWEVVRKGEVLTLELTYGRRAEPPEEEREDAPTQRRAPRSPFSASLGGQLENLQGQQGPDEQDFGGVYHSSDGGVSWRRINSVNPRPMYYSQIRVDPSDQNYIYVLGTSLYRSTDGGHRFSDDGANNEVHVDHHALWIDPRDGRHMILGNDGGIYVTNDRMKKWDHLNHVAIGQFYHIGISPALDYHVYGGMQDNGSWGGPTRVAGDTGPRNTDWYRVGSGDGFVTLVDPQDPDQIYFESQNGGMGRIHLKTGERGFIRPRPPRGVTYRFNWKTPFILSPHNPQIHYSAGNHVFKSVSKGDRVAPISPEITNTDKGAGSAIAESPRKPGVLYVGTTDGAVWVTVDDGRSWFNLFRDEDIQRLKESLAPQRGEAARRPGAEGSTEESGPEPREGRAPGGRGGAGRRGMNPQRMLAMLKQRDANGDGFIDASELPPPMARLIDRLDRDGDGKLSMHELDAPPLPGSNPPASGQSAPKAAAGQQSPQQAPAAAPPAPPPVVQPPRLGERTARSPEDAPEQTPAIETEATGAAEEENEEPPAPDPQKPSAAKPAQTPPGTVEPTGEENPAGQQPAAPDPVSGRWEGRFIGGNAPPGQNTFTLQLQLKGEDALEGFFESPRSTGDVVEGKFDRASHRLEFSIRTQNAVFDVTATLKGQRLEGQIEFQGGEFTIDFEADKAADQQGGQEPDDGSRPLEELVPGPRWVSSLEASRFADGRCYMTLDGHRSDDDQPYVLVTENYGRTWRSLRANLPDKAGSTRVVREDIKNPNVLYLGCEFSVWVSIDRGASWTRMNSNLPTVAVHEFAQHPTRGELLAGTHGRSIWIMDNHVLRQLSPESLAAPATLYEPNVVIRWRSIVSRGSPGTRAFAGENPATQARFFYSLGRRAQSAKLTVTTLFGEELLDRELETTPGLHVVDWDARGNSSQRRRSIIPPGDYLVTLRVDGKIDMQRLRVIEDPTFPSAAQFDQENALEEAGGGRASEESVSSASYGLP